MRTHLKPLELHTLLALAHEPAHGYSLVRQIEADSEGTLKPLPGNLYVVLTRLATAGLVRQIEPSGEGSRRRTYELTPIGRERLTAEGHRMARLAQTVEVRFTAPESGSR